MRFPVGVMEYCAMAFALAIMVHALAGAVGVDTLTIINRVVEVLR